jgi:hypothetical protein
MKSSNGDFYSFGGNEFGGLGNDLWKWDGTYWTWISGSSSGGQLGTYGTKGLASSGNVPGARWVAASFADLKGNLYIWGGGGFDSAGNPPHLNDLWKWDGANWTWLSGGSAGSGWGTYGTKGLASSSIVPGARWLPMYGKTQRNFYILGVGYDSAGA